MTFGEFADYLKSEGFSAGDIFGIINEFVTDLDRVTIPVLKRAMPHFRGYVDFLRKYENEIIDRSFDEKK